MESMKLKTLFGKERVPGIYDPLRILSTNERRRFVAFKDNGVITSDNDGSRKSEKLYDKEDVRLY